MAHATRLERMEGLVEQLTRNGLELLRWRRAELAAGQHGDSSWSRTCADQLVKLERDRARLQKRLSRLRADLELPMGE